MLSTIVGPTVYFAGLDPLSKLKHSHHKWTNHGAQLRHKTKCSCSPFDSNLLQLQNQVGFVLMRRIVIGPLTVSVYQLQQRIWTLILHGLDSPAVIIKLN